jgi:large-conductance mechanosensitive channel
METFRENLDEMNIENTVENKVEMDLEYEQESKFNLWNIIMTFGIIGVVFGTAIALGLNDLVKSFSVNVVNPLLESVVGRLLKKNYLKIKLRGGLCIKMDEFIFQALSFLITLLIIYLVIKFILNGFITEAIKNERKSEKMRQKQNTMIIKKLADINKNLVKSYL